MVVVVVGDDESPPPPWHAASDSIATADAIASSVLRNLTGSEASWTSESDRYADPTMATLAERLGHAPDATLLIITCDDLGLTHASNVASYEAVRDGLASSASLMVPCPWARDAAGGYRGEDIGVHLTLNAELETYRWGPITQSPSLLDGDGGFPRTVEDAWDHADLDEVRRECRAQIERAIVWGFDVSHLASHLGTLQHRPEFFDVYLELAVDFGLPLRLGDDADEHVAGFPFRRLAAEEGVVFPDRVVVCAPGARRRVERALFELEPGVTELSLHPGIDTDELRAACGDDWAGRVEDHATLCRDPAMRDLVTRAGAIVISWRDLRDLQRAPEQIQDQARITCGLEPTLHERDARVELADHHRGGVRVAHGQGQVGGRAGPERRLGHDTVVESRVPLAVAAGRARHHHLQRSGDSGRSAAPDEVADPFVGQELGHLMPPVRVRRHLR